MAAAAFADLDHSTSQAGPLNTTVPSLPVNSKDTKAMRDGGFPEVIESRERQRAERPEPRQPDSHVHGLAKLPTSLQVFLSRVLLHPVC